MKGLRGFKGTIIIVVMVLFVVGYYSYLSNKSYSAGKEAEDVKATQVQEVLLRDLSINYPPTPKEVVKYFSEITKCFYNETYTEEELVELALKIQGLYDEELIANKSQEDYLKDLKSDIKVWQDQGYTISSYSLSASTDVEYPVHNGQEWAKLYCTYTLRSKTNLQGLMEVFLLRKDEEGHWKIYGWETPKETIQAQ